MKDSIVFTKEFILKWKNILVKLHGYDVYMDYLIIPSIFRQKTLSYLPLLNYTDRRHDEIKDLLELAKDNDFQIRTLDFDYKDFKEDDTVTMRLNIFDKTSDDIFKESVKSRCRNKIRNSIKKFDYKTKHGNATKDIEDFYKIFSQTMYKHGTPVLGKKIFYNLVEEFKDDIIFFNLYDHKKVVATMCIMLDEKLVWYPWGGVKDIYTSKLVGYRIYWEVLKYICDNTDKRIFDFGRSSYGGNTYRFKSQYGAKPIKINIISSQDIDIYAQYELASKIWKKLPKNIVDLMGPKLCKYLVDL
jgi:hypothetical protein